MKQETSPTPIFRLLAVPIDDKGDTLRALVQEVNVGVSRGDAKRKDAGGEVFAVDPADFRQIPGSPFAYWSPESFLKLFEEDSKFANDDRDARDDARGLHIIGAGTFGAPAEGQKPGIPLQYNLLILDPETQTLTVETRKKDKPDGAWMADARWGDKNNPVPRYTIQLKGWKPNL